MAADAGKTDTPFRYQPPHKARSGPEDFGRLIERQEPVDGVVWPMPS